MIKTTVVLHANLLYAEIPLSDIPLLSTQGGDGEEAGRSHGNKLVTRHSSSDAAGAHRGRSPSLWRSCPENPRLLTQGLLSPGDGNLTPRARILSDAGYEWCFFDSDFIEMTEKGHLDAYNDFDPSPPTFSKPTAQAKFKGLVPQYLHLRRMERKIRRTTNFKPTRWLGAEEKSITGVICTSPGFPTH